MSATTADGLTAMIPEALVEEVFSAPLDIPYPSMADRDRWAAAGPREAAEVLDIAARCTAGPWPVLRIRDFARFLQDGDRTAYEKPYFARRHRLMAAALAACITGDRQWVIDAADGIWLLLEETTWAVPAHAWTAHGRRCGLPMPDDLDLDLFCAETAGTLAWAGHLLAGALDEVSPLIRQRIQAEIRRRVIDPFLSDRAFGWPADPVNNWNPWIHSNVLAAASLVGLEPPVRQQVVWKALRGLDRFLADTPSDGGCDEGTTYWTRAGGSLADCLWLLYDVSGGRIDGFGHPTAVGTARFLPAMHIGGTFVVNFADGDGRLDNRAGAYPLMRLGRHTGQDDAVRHASAMRAAPSSVPLVDRHASLGRLAGLLLDMPDVGQAAFPFPADGHYPLTQVAGCRERAGTAKGLFMVVKGGHNAEHHNHNDVGSFVVALDGRPLVVDIGVGTYTRGTFGPERYSIFTMPSEYHNVPPVNGCQQPPGRRYAASGWFADVTPGSVTAGMELAGAYPPQAGIGSWRRKARLDRTAGQVRITDTWQLTDAPTSLVWHLIVHEAVELDGDRILIGNPGTSRLALTTEPRLLLAVERIALDDPRLTRVWGGELHRLVLTAAPGTLTAEGELHTFLTRHPESVRPVGAVGSRHAS